MRRLLGVLVAVLWVLLAASAARASGWSLEPTPIPTGAQASELAGVSCTSPSACTAVGNYITSAGVQVTLADRWDGTSWVLQPTPNPAGAVSSSLTAVSCTTASRCVAVGQYATEVVPSTNVFKTLVERWNGGSWSIESSPNPAGATSSSLQGVSCVKANACTAVGYSQPTTSSSVILAERWNGRRWSIQPTPNPAGAAGSSFTAVSCAKRRACTAVGSTTDASGTTATLAEARNGRTWEVQSTPNSTGTRPYNVLRGISCTAPSTCTAVGIGADLATFSGGFLSVRRNGAVWTIQPTPSPGAQGGFSAVSCPATSNCTAVGSATVSLGGPGFTTAEHWDGTSWTVQPTPNPSGAVAPFLAGVSCPTAAACQAVGGTFNGVGPPRATVAEGFSQP